MKTAKKIETTQQPGYLQMIEKMFRRLALVPIRISRQSVTQRTWFRIVYSIPFIIPFHIRIPCCHYGFESEASHVFIYLIINWTRWLSYIRRPLMVRQLVSRQERNQWTRETNGNNATHTLSRFDRRKWSATTHIYAHTRTHTYPVNLVHLRWCCCCAWERCSKFYG